MRKKTELYNVLKILEEHPSPMRDAAALAACQRLMADELKEQNMKTISVLGSIEGAL